MATRSTIKLTDERGESYFIYRGHDGFPDVVLTDINRVIEKAKGRWACSEIGLLISMFFGETYRENASIQEYELTGDFHGDESYRYAVDYVNNEWVATQI